MAYITPFSQTCKKLKTALKENTRSFQWIEVVRKKGRGNDENRTYGVVGRTMNDEWEVQVDPSCLRWNVLQWSGYQRWPDECLVIWRCESKSCLHVEQRERQRDAIAI